MQRTQQIDIMTTLLEQLETGRNIDAGVQMRMPTTSYVCPDIADREWQQFFRSHPQMVGLSGDLPEPGSFLTTNDFGTPVLATRDKNGEFRAFVNACRHRAVQVSSDERGRRNVFTCPFHHWSYANTGDLISLPDEHDFGAVDKSCNGLIPLPAVERGGMLWVHPQPDGELDLDALLGAGLIDELGALFADNYGGDLVYGAAKTITMNLNWKLANDTFGETYHFRKLHKDTLGLIYPGNNLHLEHFGRHHRFTTAAPKLLEFKALPEAEWHFFDGIAFTMYYLFPNVQIIFGGNNVTLLRFYPEPGNPGRSTTRITLYGNREAIAAEQSDESLLQADSTNVYQTENAGAIGAIAANLEVFSSTVEHEDYVMGEMQQRSAESGALKEIVFGRNEPALHHFHSSFHEELGLPPLERVGG